MEQMTDRDVMEMRSTTQYINACFHLTVLGMGLAATDWIIPTHRRFCCCAVRALHHVGNVTKFQSQNRGLSNYEMIQNREGADVEVLSFAAKLKSCCTSRVLRIQSLFTRPQYFHWTSLALPVAVAVAETSSGSFCQERSESVLDSSCRQLLL